MGKYQEQELRARRLKRKLPGVKAWLVELERQRHEQVLGGNGIPLTKDGEIITSHPRDA